MSAAQALAGASLARAGQAAFAAAFAAARMVLWRDRPVYGLIALHCLICVVALSAGGFERAFAFDAYLVVWPAAFLLFFPTLLVLGLVLQVVHRTERRRALAFRRVFSPARLGRLAAGAVLLLALMAFQGSFTSVKNAMPLLQGGFPYELPHADIDRWLHFGRDPWLYLHGWDAGGALRLIVEWNYVQGWFLLCFGTLFAVAVLPEADRVRTRYMLAYLTVWILVGNILAGLFLSAGPVFYGHVTGDAGRFAGLVEALGGGSGAAFSAAGIQAALWALHSSGESGLGSGISAFPSVHVATVTLNALFLREWKPRLGSLAFGYVGLILASSVYLGWHYAIDGYAGGAVAVAVYLLFRRLGIGTLGGSAGKC